MDQRQLAFELRDEAMARAQAGAGPSWNALADRVLRRIAESRPFLTSDDVRDELCRLGVPEVREMRALGPVMMRGAKDGIIARAPTFARKRRPQHHANVSTVWQSTIYMGEP
jgi:hypothetical protein